MKYVFLDIDGTLYASSVNATPDSAVEAIRLARENGAKVFLCTGRALGECKRYLHYDVDGFIFASGAMIYADGNRIYDCPIPSKDVQTIRTTIQTLEMGYSFEGACGAYCNPLGYECALSYFAGNDTHREKLIENAMANCFFEEKHWHEEDEKIYKVCVYNRHSVGFDELIKQIPSRYLCTPTVEDPHGWDVAEITTAHITKATGISKILDYYGGDMKDTIAVGDSPNDLPMIQACNLGIAMGNAFETVKQAADYVTTDILDHGIYNAFVYAGLINKK